MITLTRAALQHLTGQDLLALLAQDPNRINGIGCADLQVDGQAWRAYTSTCRGAHRGITFHLWTPATQPVRLQDGTDTGTRTVGAVHIRGDITERIGEMQLEQ